MCSSFSPALTNSSFSFFTTHLSIFFFLLFFFFLFFYFFFLVPYVPLNDIARGRSIQGGSLLGSISTDAPQFFTGCFLDSFRVISAHFRHYCLRPVLSGSCCLDRILRRT